ncbi:MAG: cytochrome b/b6 domain-containing protein [Acidimicrobiales bacterium]
MANLHEEATPTRVAVRRHRRGNRWMHWINFPLLVIMIYSGLRIYRAEEVYAFGLFGWEWFAFFPDGFNESLDLDRRLARGLAFHFTFAWLFTLNGVAYAIYIWRTGEWRQIFPTRQHVKGVVRDVTRTVLHDLHLRKEAPPRRGRYNEAQRLTYSLVLVLGALAILSGFAIFKPTQLSALTWLLGGYTSARIIHFSVTFLFVVFFVIHILQVARSGWRMFTSMITGYELQDRAAEPTTSTSTTSTTSTTSIEEVTSDA